MNKALTAKPVSKQSQKPQIRIMFRKAIAMGPGKADLLRAIQETGSISAAARKMDMSYRRAWLLVDTMNRCFREPLVASATGGPGGGGAEVTAFGRQVLARYAALQESVERAMDRSLPPFADLLK